MLLPRFYFQWYYRHHLVLMSFLWFTNIHSFSLRHASKKFTLFSTTRNIANPYSLAWFALPSSGCPEESELGRREDVMHAKLTPYRCETSHALCIPFKIRDAQRRVTCSLVSRHSSHSRPGPVLSCMSCPIITPTLLFFPPSFPPFLPVTV